MKTKDYSYFIERYLSGEMPESERQWFIREMEDNRDLKDEIELRKQTDEILRKRSVMDLRSKLSEIEITRRENKRAATIRRITVMKYAAVFAGAALITSLILFTGKTLTSEEIINRYYSAYEAPSSIRSSVAATNTEYLLGLKYYNNKDYRNAASQFAKVLEKNPDDMQTHLLSGVSNMEVKKYNEAKKSFTTVIDDNNNLFIESAKWYLALCYVQTDDVKKASDILTEIRNEGGIYSKDASKILRRIN
jgi:tetratricopeptide (TPR) repeat protein